MFRLIRDYHGEEVVINLNQVVDVYEDTVGKSVIEMSNGRKVIIDEILSEVEAMFNRKYN